MGNTKRWVIFVLILLSILVSFYFDSYILKIISLIRTDTLNDILLGITFKSTVLLVFFILTSFLLWRDRKGRWVFPLWIILAFSGVVNYLVKIAVQRPRPFQLGIISTLPILANSSHLSWNSSFPSFHAMFAFAALPILLKQFPRLKYFWITLALLFAFTRVYFGLHFLSDVIAGALLGYLVGWIILKTETKNKFWSKIYNKIEKLLKKI